MTKREHDAATQHNYGCPRGDRTAYRASRGHVTATDYVGQRAAAMALRNAPSRLWRDGYLPTLGAGSRYRNLAAWRARNGAALLAT